MDRESMSCHVEHRVAGEHGLSEARSTQAPFSLMGAFRCAACTLDTRCLSARTSSGQQQASGACVIVVFGQNVPALLRASGARASLLSCRS